MTPRFEVCYPNIIPTTLVSIQFPYVRFLSEVLFRSLTIEHTFRRSQRQHSVEYQETLGQQPIGLLTKVLFLSQLRCPSSVVSTRLWRSDSVLNSRQFAALILPIVHSVTAGLSGVIIRNGAVLRLMHDSSTHRIVQWAWTAEVRRLSTVKEFDRK